MNRVPEIRRQLAAGYDVDHPEVVRRTVDGLHADVFDPLRSVTGQVLGPPWDVADCGCKTDGEFIYHTDGCVRHPMNTNYREPARCPEPAPRTASHTSGAGSPIQPECYPPRCQTCGGAIMATDKMNAAGTKHYDCAVADGRWEFRKPPPVAKERV